MGSYAHRQQVRGQGGEPLRLGLVEREGLAQQQGAARGTRPPGQRRGLGDRGDPLDPHAARLQQPGQGLAPRQRGVGRVEEPPRPAGAAEQHAGDGDADHEERHQQYAPAAAPEAAGGR
ncbi:hypothetical protein GCM10018952_59590 [Streptosporangium vulgare]